MQPKVRGLGLEVNGPFWADYISNVFLPYIGVIRRTVFERLLPSFESVDKEADSVMEETWKRLGQRAGPDTDPGDLAEAAHDAGVDYYVMVAAAKQQALNLYTVGLHHLLEQQQLQLLRRELLPRDEEDSVRLLNRNEFVTRLLEQGIDPTAYESWNSLEDLRFAANAIKHAEGQAAQTLKTRRPELFVYPLFRGDEVFGGMAEIQKVYSPLAGEDIWIAESDLSGFFDAVDAFWNSLRRDLYRAATD